MKPEKITLKNFGPFNGTHIVDFTTLGDIFLIYGKTGAGKTSIFDAIAYALYGNIPGGRKGLIKEMRSHFADETEESAVELIFSLANKRYRIRRALPTERTNKKTGKITDVPETLTLEKDAAGIWKDYGNANKSEVKEAILNLIGLSLDEFSRIVLLPQGEFAQFLKQTSSARKQVLAKLFPMERYTQVIASARDLAWEAEARLKVKETSINELQARYDPSLYDESLLKISTGIQEGRTQRQHFLDLYSKQSRICEQAKVVTEKATALIQAKKDHENYAADKEKIATKEETLVLAKKAAPLLFRIEQRNDLMRQQEAGALELQKTTERQEEAETALTELKEKQATIALCKTEKETLLLQQQNLSIAVGIAKAILKETEKLTETKKSLKTLRETIADKTRESTVLNTKLEELTEPISHLEERTEKKETIEKKLHYARQLQDLSAEFSRQTLAVTAHSGAAEKTATRLNQATTDLSIARAELQDSIAERERNRMEHLAATIAESLTPGTPCPVCGSAEHPQPALRATDAFDTADRIEAKERQCQKLETSIEIIKEEITTQKANLNTAKEREYETREKIAVLMSQQEKSTELEPPTPSEAAEYLKNASQEMQEAVNALTQSQKALREAEIIRKRRATFSGESEKTTQELEAISQTLAELKTTIAINTTRYKETFQQDSIPDPAFAEEALEICKSRLLELDGKIRVFEARFEAAKINSAKLSERKKQLEQASNSLKTQTEIVLAELSESCIKSGFSDAIAVTNAARETFEIERLEKEIAEWKKGYENTKTEAARLSEEITAWKGPDLKTAEQELNVLATKLSQVEALLEEKNKELSSLESLNNQWITLEKEREKQSKDAGVLVALSQDLTGVNSEKLSFDAWILGTYLEEITAYANTRLERISDGRYRIQVNNSYKKGNNLTGLDLEILDAYTGKTRPTGTLSGGETFMASISLALGLADSIQARSGGIQLDAVFIDEGFGSLDETTLEKAIGILDEIRGHRMVGIISHVPELRSRIPSRIEITKTQTGSTISQGEIV